MLKHLHIENYALIESLDIELQDGFSVITGETGAGKSILLGALGLLTGGRADISAIQEGKQKCTLEAVFGIEGTGLRGGLKDFFIEEDLDYFPDECIIRRELMRNGKSRAFINDTPTTLATLKLLGERLIDIHSQHQNLLLGEEDFQLSVLDTVAGNSALRQSYSDAYGRWKEAGKHLCEAQKELEENRKDEDYMRFLLSELDDFKPQPDEDETLQQRCDLMEHARDIRMVLMQGAGLLSEGECPVIGTLRQMRNQLSSIQEVFPKASELAERIDSCRIELQDIADTLESEGEKVECNQEELEAVRDRLGRLFALEQKHHVSCSGELAGIMLSLSEKTGKMDNGEEYIRELQRQEQEALTMVLQEASLLTASRRQAVEKVERSIVSSLKKLGMPNIRFQVDVTSTGSPLQDGMDSVSFLFSANLGASLQPVSQVASGGETARVMLSVKALLSGAVSLPTIVFDEIDTGVSGHIAESMAHIMHDMGLHGRQVISITHLPQIAARGMHHYKVWKEDTGGQTLSHISLLSTEERVTEIANMLSGSSVSAEAVSNARALLGIA